MGDQDELFSRCLEEGRRAARISRAVASNPYLDIIGAEQPAWVEGFASVGTSAFTLAERASIFNAGHDAGELSEPAASCPHQNDDDPERMEIWVLGYAPHVEPVTKKAWCDVRA